MYSFVVDMRIDEFFKALIPVYPTKSAVKPPFAKFGHSHLRVPVS